MLDMSGSGYIGDSGSIILVETNIVLTGADYIKLNVYTPNKETKVWTASIDPTNNKYIKYVVQDGDFSVSGIYYLQPEVSVGGFKGKGETIKITIKQSFS